MEMGRPRAERTVAVGLRGTEPEGSGPRTLRHTGPTLATWLAATLFLTMLPGPLRAQPRDSAQVHDRARGLQASFERTRVRNLPLGSSGSGGRCDEIIGRLCIWDGGDDGWTPRPEDPVIIERRDALLADLDALADESPNDPWILGQRVRYRVEAGAFDEAAAVARRCGLEDRWLCDAFLGLALHQSGDIQGAEAAFRGALGLMPAEVRREWTDTDALLDGELRDWLAERPDSAAARALLWRFSDPLFLVPGNDRWTGHLARWSWAVSSERTRSPHQLSWGDDLTESVVRYGWPVAWERPWPRGGEVTPSGAIGHDPPAAQRFIPGRGVLEGPGDDAWEEWPLTRKGMRTVYLPPYLDSIRTLDGQVGHFRTEDGARFVAAGTVDFEGFREHEGSARLGLYFRGAAGEAGGAPGQLEHDGRVWADVSQPSGEGGVSGAVSLEVLFPEWRRAQRARYSVYVPALPPDVITLSDVMVLGAGPEPTSPDDVAKVLRPDLRMAPHEELRIAFEVYGMGFRSEPATFRVWLERTDRGFLSRATRWLGFGDDGGDLAVSWTEPGPETPQPLFRTLELSLPGLDDGTYDLIVGVTTPGRSEARRRRSIRVGPVENPR